MTNRISKLVVVPVFIVVLLLSVCSASAASYNSLDVHEAYTMIIDGSYPSPVFLDIRTPGEYSASHIQNAINIPYLELENRISELAGYEDRMIIVIGARSPSGSMIVSIQQILGDHGFPKASVWIMEGGIEAWVDANYPLVCQGIDRSIEGAHTVQVPAEVTVEEETGFYNKFHTGAPYTDLLWSTHENYKAWASARPYVKLAYVEGADIINSDGSITHTLFIDMTDDLLQSIFNQGKIPVMQLWVTNIDTVTEGALRNYFRRLSNFNSLKGRPVIWMPCYEFNFASRSNSAWGDRGNGQSWNLDPVVYNRVMGWIRNILDSEGITNILLGVHMNLYDYPNAHTAYLEGMRKADVHGSSLYAVGRNEAEAQFDAYWENTRKIYDAIGTGKPWIYFEYAFKIGDPQAGSGYWFVPMTRDKVDRSYQKLTSYPFVKGICWYFPASVAPSDTMQAIADNAQTYEGR